MTYAEKLRDPRWQKKRLQILERDGWRCKHCLSGEKNLQVHHLYYARKNPWEYPDSCYQTLCDECHKTRQTVVDEGIENIRVMLGEVPNERLVEIVSSAVSASRREINKSVSVPVTKEEGRAWFSKMRKGLEE